MSKRRPAKRPKRFGGISEQSPDVRRTGAGHGKRRAFEEERKPGAKGPGGGRSGPPHRNDRRDDGPAERGPPLKIPGLDVAKQNTERAIAAWLKDAALLAETRRAEAAPGAAVSLDPWQQHVLDALVQGDSVVVDAPTTAGKTRAVEVFFRQNLQNPAFRACYTTPVKSLSNDKLREFREMFGEENVGIATGDIKENLGAPIVVATLESYRNSLLGTEPDLGRTIAVFDEYHYLQDESRGSAWEEALILTPRSCQVLLLSASVANAEEFCDWLKSLGEGRNAVLVRTETRPVPLEHLIYLNGVWLLPETIPAGALQNLDRERMAKPVRQEELAKRLITVLPLKLSPVIVYAGRRLACETMAQALLRELTPLPPADSEKIGLALMKSQEEFGGLTFVTPKLRHMMQVYGVGFHHSGLAAPARMAIEALVKQGLLRFCVATMGLSLGINFSVRSALISDYERPGEMGFTDYAPSEVLQMLGRAGRRGKDKVGFSLWPSPEAYARMGKARRDKISSRLRNDPTTFLGLIGRGFSLRAIEHFYGKSFRRFQSPNVDLSLITKSRLQKKLQADDLPCASPAAELALFWNEDSSSACGGCRHRVRCHPMLEAKSGGSLTAMHLHLHRIGALSREESLTDFGKIARYFPQAGGMLIARMIADGRINPENLHRFAELAAGLTLARFKEPGYDSSYKWPFKARELEDELMELYPMELFEEIYDQPYGRRNFPVLREFNPTAGFILREWIQGAPWKELNHRVTTEAYGTGDVMSLIYRVATYMQSIVQADIPGMRDMARTIRDLLLREPLAFALNL